MITINEDGLIGLAKVDHLTLNLKYNNVFFLDCQCIKLLLFFFKNNKNVSN